MTPPSASASAPSADVTKPLLGTDLPGTEGSTPRSGSVFSCRLSAASTQDDGSHGRDDDDRFPASTSASTSSSMAPQAQTSLRSRIAAAMVSFFVLGLFTPTLGVVLPALEAFYHLGDVQVSVIFLALPVGYVAAAQLNGLVHLRFGQRGIAVLGPLFHIVFTAAAAAHPPFPLLLLAVSVGSFGTGLIDASWCAWAASLEGANAVSGLLHGSYCVGASVGPFLAGTLLAAGHKPWYYWYYVLVAASAVELAVLVYAFRHQDAQQYRADKHHQHELDADVDENDDNTFLAHAKDLLGQYATWVCAAYALIYAGTELAVVDWIVIYMMRARGASAYVASICSSAFSIGMAAGRMGLGTATDRIGVRPATALYLVCAMGADLLFAALDSTAASVGIMALLGFFFGPLYPSWIVQLNLLLPPALHVPAVSFVASLGQVGAAVLPFGLGALANKVGIEVFQTVVFVQLTASLVLWMMLPRPSPSALVEAGRVSPDEETPASAPSHARDDAYHDD